MTWTWTYENADGEPIGQSSTFDNRGDAETWIGEHYDELTDDGVDQVRLHEDDTEVYGPMSLHAD